MRKTLFALAFVLASTSVHASPLIYHFTGVVGHRDADHAGLFVYDGWADQIIRGEFTFDPVSSLYTAWEFSSLGLGAGPSMLAWLGPRSPSPWLSRAYGDAYSVEFGLFLPQQAEYFQLLLGFDRPLFDGASYANGWLSRTGAPGYLVFPVSGALTMPEPASWLLIVTGLAGMVWLEWRRRWTI